MTSTPLPSALPTSAPPVPRAWKTWLMTVVGIYPVIVVIAAVITPLTDDWPAPARLAIIVPIAVAAFTWVIGPRLRGALHVWLSR